MSEQAKPTPGTTAITPLVIADLEARSAEGLKKYGRPLEAYNGRDALRDMYEEILDAAQYARQLLQERAESMPTATIDHVEFYDASGPELSKEWAEKLWAQGAEIARLNELLIRRSVDKDNGITFAWCRVCGFLLEYTGQENVELGHNKDCAIPKGPK